MVIGGLDLGDDHFAVKGMLREKDDQIICGFDFLLDSFCPIFPNLDLGIDEHIMLSPKRFIYSRSHGSIWFHVTLIADEYLRHTLHLMDREGVSVVPS
jgi:hypothetical protein